MTEGAWQHRFTANEVHSALLWLGGVCAEWVRVRGGRGHAVEGMGCATVVPWPADDRGHNAARRVRWGGGGSSQSACESAKLEALQNKAAHSRHAHQLLVCRPSMPPLAQPAPYARPLRETTTLCILDREGQGGMVSVRGRGRLEGVEGMGAQAAGDCCNFLPFKHVDVLRDCLGTVCV